MKSGFLWNTLFTDNVLTSIIFIYNLWDLFPFMSQPSTIWLSQTTLPWTFCASSLAEITADIRIIKPKWTSSQASHTQKGPQWDVLDSYPLRRLNFPDSAVSWFPFVSLTGLFQVPPWDPLPLFILLNDWGFPASQVFFLKCSTIILFLGELILFKVQMLPLEWKPSQGSFLGIRSA